jgi:hypothetical protein
VNTLEIDAFLADAVVNVEGKLYAQGIGWNVLTVRSLPATHTRMGIGALIHVPYTATNMQHTLSITLEDADGQPVAVGAQPDGEKLFTIATNFTIGRPPTIVPGEEQIVPLAIQIDNIRFEKADAYNFVFKFAEAEAKRLPFRVRT